MFQLCKGHKHICHHKLSVILCFVTMHNVCYKQMCLAIPAVDKDGLIIAVGVGISDAAQEVKKWCCME